MSPAPLIDAVSDSVAFTFASAAPMSEISTFLACNVCALKSPAPRNRALNVSRRSIQDHIGRAVRLDEEVGCAKLSLAFEIDSAAEFPAGKRLARNRDLDAMSRPHAFLRPNPQLSVRYRRGDFIEEVFVASNAQSRRARRPVDFVCTACFDRRKIRCRASIRRDCPVATNPKIIAGGEQERRNQCGNGQPRQE